LPFCPNCGTLLAPNQRVCPKCGSDLTSRVLSVQPQTPIFGVTSAMSPYLKLAEFAYLGQVAYALAASALLFIDFAFVYSNSALSLVAAALGLSVTYAWWQLGRSPRTSFLVYAGIFGMGEYALSAVLALSTLFVSVSSGLSPLAGLTVAIGLLGLVYLYFQTRAFLLAGRALKVGLFRYAGFAFVGGYIAILAVSLGILFLAAAYLVPVVLSGGQMPTCTVSSTSDYCSLLFRAVFVQTGGSYLSYGLVASLAGMGFRRVRSTPS